MEVVLACLVVGEGIYQQNHSRVPWEKLSGAETIHLDGSEWSTLTATDVVTLHESVLVALVADDFAKWKSCCTGLSVAQLAIIPPLALRNMHPVCLKSLSTEQFAALSAAQLVNIPTQIAHEVSRAQMASLTPKVCREVTGNTLAKYLTASACRGISSGCAAAMSAEAFAAMTPACIIRIRPSVIAALEPDSLGWIFATLTPQQMSALTVDQCQMVLPLWWEGVTVGCAGLKEVCLRALEASALAAIPPGCAAQIAAPVLHAMSEYPSLLPSLRASVLPLIAGSWVRMEALGADVCAVLPPQDAMTLPASLCEKVSDACAKRLGPTVLEALTPECIAQFPLESLVRIPTHLVAVLNPLAFTAFTTEHFAALTPFQCAAVTHSQATAVPMATLCTAEAKGCLKFSKYASYEQLAETCGAVQA